MEAILFKTDGTQETIIPANGKNFSLKECYSHIGCDMIEVAYLNNAGKPNDPIFICDEEGLYSKNNLLNRQATEIYRESWQDYSIGLVGNVIYCPSRMLR